jgi:hypothetical protein
VTERTGAEKYTDAPPSTAPVGFNYSHYTGNPCPYGIIPLSSNKTTLKDAIDDLTSVGATAGQIGIAWGWYLLSPNWGYLWPAESQPLAYGADELIKVMIFMTDGELNTGYANGVIAQDSGNIPNGASGIPENKINMNATNVSIHTSPPRLSSYSQARQLCDAMKATGILIYTVGFALGEINDAGSAEAAVDLVEKCATDPTYVYLPESGADLAEAFQAIAINVARLHLSK